MVSKILNEGKKGQEVNHIYIYARFPRLFETENPQTVKAKEQRQILERHR